MKTFIQQAQFYSEYHQKKMTLYTHLIGVPLIIFSLMIFLGYFHLIVPSVFHTTLADISTVILFLYYLKLNWRLGLLLFPVLALLLWLSYLLSHNGPSAVNVWIMIVAFVLGWALQLAGHYLEGSKPALLKSLEQALVAPLFLVAELCFMAGFMPKLREQLHGPVIVPVPADNLPPPPIPSKTTLDE